MNDRWAHGPDKPSSLVPVPLQMPHPFLLPLCVPEALLCGFLLGLSNGRSSQDMEGKEERGFEVCIPLVLSTEVIVPRQ